MVIDRYRGRVKDSDKIIEKVVVVGQPSNSRDRESGDDTKCVNLMCSNLRFKVCRGQDTHISLLVPV